MELPLDDETLQRLYAWIDEIPLSRPKKSIARDFSDGLLAAEVVAFYFPKAVQMHNYSPANSAKQKLYNWHTLNRKVFKRLHIFLSKDDIDDLIASYREKRPPCPPSGRLADNNNDALAASAAYSPSSSAGVASIAGNPGGGGGAGSGSSSAARSPLPFDKVAEAAPSPHGFPAGYSAEHYASANKMYSGGAGADAGASNWRSEIRERDATISEQRETIQVMYARKILEMKVQKLEQLVRLKDGKIQTLVAKLRSQKPPS
ncbi:hypothetical protein PybrP1_011538 [[Pythium] brassicae (nom. inval.)]|nr:hypothetical protein PybrP1_011538 [[Pythium] brassicae (nom. inval.)]